jgi:hypothetical protein
MRRVLKLTYGEKRNPLISIYVFKKDEATLIFKEKEFIQLLCKPHQETIQIAEVNCTEILANIDDIDSKAAEFFFDVFTPPFDRAKCVRDHTKKGSFYFEVLWYGYVSKEEDSYFECFLNSL